MNPQWSAKELLRSRPAIIMVALSVLVRVAYTSWAHFGPNDGEVYDDYAHHLYFQGTYASNVGILPEKAPGYPFVLFLLYRVFGLHHGPIYFVQHFADLVTAVLCVLIARRFGLGKTGALVAFGIALFNPFTLVHASLVLSETLATLLITLGMLLLIGAREGDARWPVRLALFGGLISYAALTKPVFAPVPGVLLIAALVLRMARFTTWLRWSTVALTGFLVVWAPWAIRNSVVLHRFIPYHDAAYSQRPGYNEWAYNWALTMLDVNNAWYEKPPTLQARAFESPAERARIEALLAQAWAKPPPDVPEQARIDGEFRRLAHERRDAHLARYYLVNPAVRCLAMWFTREVTVLAQANVKTSEFRSAIRARPLALAAKLSLFALAFLLPALMVVGAISLWRRGARAIGLPIAAAAYVTLAIQLIILTQPQMGVAMEPRYVIEFFPALTPLGASGALVALAFAQRILSKARGWFSRGGEGSAPGAA